MIICLVLLDYKRPLQLSKDTRIPFFTWKSGILDCYLLRSYRKLTYSELLKPRQEPLPLPPQLQELAALQLVPRQEPQLVPLL